MQSLFTTAQWQKARTEYMTAARACRDTLTNQEGYWKYSPEDERVKDAVGKWVQRAREAHSIALGRRPVIEKTIVINQGQAVEGQLYAA